VGACVIPGEVTTMSKRGKKKEADRARALAAGSAKHLDPAEKVRIQGEVLTAAGVVARLGALPALRDGVEAANAAVATKLEADRTEGPSLRRFAAAYEAFVQLAFATRPDILVDFGLEARKPRRKATPEEQAAAVAKRAATRAARHTMGPRRKQAIKGDVVGVTVTPIGGAEPGAATGRGAHGRTWVAGLAR
jgi:hypothetical protein